MLKQKKKEILKYSLHCKLEIVNKLATSRRGDAENKILWHKIDGLTIFSTAVIDIFIGHHEENSIPCTFLEQWNHFYLF